MKPPLRVLPIFWQLPTPVLLIYPVRCENILARRAVLPCCCSPEVPTHSRSSPDISQGCPHQKKRRMGIIQRELSPTLVWAVSALARLLTDNETNFRLFFHNDRSLRPPSATMVQHFWWGNFRWGISKRLSRPTLTNRNFQCNKDIAASACPNSALTQLHEHKILGKQNNNMKL